MTLYNNALSEFLDRYQDNDNEWFALDHGEAQNMFDAAVESIAVLGARAERAEAERDAVRAEVARLQREKAVAVAVANDREHNEHALEAEVARLRAEITRMSDEFADVLEVAIARGAALGYDSDSDYIQRWEELTGDEWVEE